MEKSLIIIGGGLTGLSAGCYGRMNGYRTSIFEMHKIPGGVCTGWKRRGYTIDGAMNTLAGTSPDSVFHKYWQDLGAAQRWKIVNHSQYQIVEGDDGSVFTMFTDIDRLEKHMLELAPEDETVVNRCCRAARYCRKIEIPIEKPQELFGVLDGFRMIRLLPVLIFLRKWGRISALKYNRRFKNIFMREAFCIRPETEFYDMPAINVPMELAWLSMKDAGYVVGGALALSGYVEDRYRKLGGELHLNSRVEKILVENDKAIGVKLADGSEHRSDIVISAADGHATIFDMLEGKYTDRRINDYYENLPLRPPLIYVNLGVVRKFDDIPSTVEGLTFPLETPITIAHRVYEKLTVQIYNFDPGLAPEGRTLVRVQFNTDFNFWEKLAKDKKMYDAEKVKIADEIVDRLDKRFPGLGAEVEMRDVATPMTWVRYTGNWRGAYEGWMMTPETFMLPISKTLPGLDNFYMTGQWVSPGGGLSTAAMCGNHIIQIICNKDKKKFVTS